jgi:hypothetical protein
MYRRREETSLVEKGQVLLYDVQAKRVGDNPCKEGKNLAEDGQFGDCVTSLWKKEHVLQRVSGKPCEEGKILAYSRRKKP